MRAIRRILSLVVGTVLALPVPAIAQQNLNVRVSVAQASYQALREIPVMVSVIKDGSVFRQQESHINNSARFAVPVGLYDVRLEGAGMETLVKRGIHVLEGQTTDVIGGPMQAGTGIRVVEYATGGLAREEVAARLAKLDSEVAELEASLAGLEASVAELKQEP
jgi:hypothetical protein